MKGSRLLPPPPPQEDTDYWNTGWDMGVGRKGSVSSSIRVLEHIREGLLCSSDYTVQEFSFVLVDHVLRPLVALIIVEAGGTGASHFGWGRKFVYGCFHCQVNEQTLI